MKKTSLPEIVKIVRDADESAKGIDSPVPVVKTGIGDMMEDGLGIQGPVPGQDKVGAQAALRTKLDGSSDGVLRKVLIGISIYDPCADLKIGDNPCVGLYKVIADETGETDHMGSGSLVNIGIGSQRILIIDE